MIPVTATNRHIAIVGVGGVGTWAAIACALVNRGHAGRISSLTLFDRDCLERKNLARVPFDSGNIRSAKVLVVKDYLIHACGFTNHIDCVQEAITPDTLPLWFHEHAAFDTVICTTDTIDSQRLLNEWCHNNDIRYKRAGYDGDTINICTAFPLTSNVAAEAADQGYHGVPEVYHAMLAGTLAAYSVLKDPITYMGDVKDIGALSASLMPDSIRDAIIKADGGTVRGLRDIHTMSHARRVPNCVFCTLRVRYNTIRDLRNELSNYRDSDDDSDNDEPEEEE